MTGLLDDELRQSLLTSYTGEYYTDNPPTEEQLQSKCHDCLTLRNVNSNRRRLQGDNSTQSAKPNLPTNWTNPNTNQNRTVAQNTGYSQNSGYNQSSQQNVQNQVSSQRSQIQKQSYVSKPPIDRSNYNCFACGELGHVQKDCGSYRKTLCRMGSGPPAEICDSDEISRFFAAAIRVAPLYCFHCLEEGHMKPRCPYLKGGNQAKASPTNGTLDRTHTSLPRTNRKHLRNPAVMNLKS